MSEERDIDFGQLEDPAPDLFRDEDGNHLRIFIDPRRIRDLRVLRRLLTVRAREQIAACMPLKRRSDRRG